VTIYHTGSAPAAEEHCWCQWDPPVLPEKEKTDHPAGLIETQLLSVGGWMDSNQTVIVVVHHQLGTGKALVGGKGDGKIDEIGFGMELVVMVLGDNLVRGRW
jgi:hypothetical protein